MHRPILAVPCAVLLLATALPAADEFDALLARFDPPARFADHKPNFSVEERTFTFKARDGEWNWTFSVIKDGERYVAVMPHEGFHGGTIYLLTHDPAQAPTELPMPSERWHIDTAIGYACRTDHFIPDRNGSKMWNYKDQSEWIVAPDGCAVTLRRVFQGKHAFRKWEHNTHKREVQVDHTGLFVLSVHPQLGYMLDCTWDTGLQKGAPVGQYTSLMPPGMSNPWPDAGVCQRCAFTPAGSDGIEGWAMNGTCIDKAGGEATMRDGGFGIYLDRESGWSNAMTLAGGDAKLSICNVHADLDYCVKWPAGIEPEENGLKHHVVRVRMLFAPPEITTHIWESMRMRYVGAGNTVIIGLGATEDFEDQPAELDTTKRGITFGFAGHKYAALITDRAAHSGSKSLVVSGSVWPNIPQVVVEPGVRYRLSAWIKSDPLSEEQMDAHRQQYDAMVERKKAEFPQVLQGMKDKWLRRVDRAKKKGKQPPPEPNYPTEPDIPSYVPPGGYITGKLYRWSPHNARKNNDWAGSFQTGVALPGAGWQEVSFEFTAPDWGPFIDIVFHCQATTAYVDDFRFGKVEE